jgi:hypothetical protein
MLRNERRERKEDDFLLFTVSALLCGFPSAIPVRVFRVVRGLNFPFLATTTQPDAHEIVFRT